MLGAVVGGQSLRRRQNGGQGAAKTFGAVEMGGQNGSKWLKIAFGGGGADTQQCGGRGTPEQMGS